MALKQAIQIVNKAPTISAGGHEPLAIFGDYTVAAGLVLNDVIEMAILPAGHVVMGVKLSTEDLDTGAALVLDCGLISGKSGLLDNGRTCGNEAFAASTVGQAGGVANENKINLLNMVPLDTDVSIGLKVATAAAGLVVGAKIRLTVLARPKLNGV
jgi:hypothetical protein